MLVINIDSIHMVLETFAGSYMATEKMDGPGAAKSNNRFEIGAEGLLLGWNESPWNESTVRGTRVRCSGECAV